MTEKSPYLMVYGLDAVLSVKIAHLSLRVMSFEAKENKKSKEEELDLVEEELKDQVASSIYRISKEDQTSIRHQSAEERF